jgi:hypothetical protein
VPKAFSPKINSSFDEHRSLKVTKPQGQFYQCFLQDREGLLKHHLQGKLLVQFFLGQSFSEFGLADMNTTVSMVMMHDFSPIPPLVFRLLLLLFINIHTSLKFALPIIT